MQMNCSSRLCLEHTAPRLHRFSLTLIGLKLLFEFRNLSNSGGGFFPLETLSHPIRPLHNKSLSFTCSPTQRQYTQQKKTTTNWQKWTHVEAFNRHYICQPVAVTQDRIHHVFFLLWLLHSNWVLNRVKVWPNLAKTHAAVSPYCITRPLMSFD